MTLLSQSLSFSFTWVRDSLNRRERTRTLQDTLFYMPDCIFNSTVTRVACAHGSKLETTTTTTTTIFRIYSDSFNANRPYKTIVLLLPEIVAYPPFFSN